MVTIHRPKRLVTIICSEVSLCEIYYSTNGNFIQDLFDRSFNMANVTNTMKIIKSSVGAINPKYDMTVKNMNDIFYNSQGQFDMICNAFKFGYMQGMKAMSSKKVGDKNA